MIGPAFSLRLGITLYLNYPNSSISILRDIYGVERTTTRLSLREKVNFLEKYVVGRKELIERHLEAIKRDNAGKVNLGVFKSKDGNKRSFIWIAAGLTALKDRNLLKQLELHTVSPLEKDINAPYKHMPPEDFPGQVEEWIVNQVEKHRDPGTELYVSIREREDKDKKTEYDFWLKEMVPLLYVFRDDADLLTNRACEALIHQGLRPLLGQRRFLTYSVTMSPGVKALFAAAIVGGVVISVFSGGLAAIFAGLGISLTATIILAIAGGLSYPETENHVLLTHSSIYLANQWVKENPRGIARFDKEPYSSLPLENAGEELEELLLQATGRIVYNDFFETNARPYSAFSMHPLMMLLSYAGSKKGVIGAHNAMDFSSLKFAAQSLQSQRYCPFRRNYKHGSNIELYRHDHVPRVMGALSAERAWDDASFTIIPEDKIKWNPGAEFALWACLMNYRIPHLLLDFMHEHEDPSRQAAGHWTRCQARFSNDHYKEGHEPRYFNGDGTIFMNAQTFESAPEFYFRTSKFVNSWGGNFNRYEVRYDGLAAFKDRKKVRRGTHEYDRLTRNSIVLLGRPPLPNWTDSPTELNANALYAFDPNSWDTKSSCYKNFTYAARQKISILAAQRTVTSIIESEPPVPVNVLGAVGVPSNWIRNGLETTVSSPTGDRSITFSFFDMTASNQEGNNDFGIYVIVGSLSEIDGYPYIYSFWEVVSAERFSNINLLRNFVIQTNLGTLGQTFQYHMTTEDTIVLSVGSPQSFLGFQHFGGFPLSDKSGILHVIDPTGNKIDPDDRIAFNEKLNFPLIEILEVDEKYQFTGRAFARSMGNGIVRITNNFAGLELELDSSDYRNPRRLLTTLE